MKTEQLRKAIIERYLKQWVQPGGKWSWNEDGTVDVIGDVAVHYLKNMKKLPVKFNLVSGFFSCASTSLISLEGVPKQVEHWFRWESNNEKFTEAEIRNVCDVIDRVVVYDK